MFKEIRLQRKLTLRQAANGIGISFTYLGEIERDLKTPGFGVLQQICDFYKLSFDLYEKIVVERKLQAHKNIYERKVQKYK